MSKSVHGHDSTETSTCLQELAHCYNKLGKLNEATNMLEIAVLTMERLLGEEHMDAVVHHEDRIFHIGIY
jgi:lipopolysaccharide biosynthesis regulator YciM